jgi:hypothetical protein
MPDVPARRTNQPSIYKLKRSGGALKIAIQIAKNVLQASCVGEHRSYAIYWKGMLKHLRLSLAFLWLLSLLSACGKHVAEPVAFELYAGHAALPPPQQSISVIQGLIQPQAVVLTYNTSDGMGDESGEVTLLGAERQRCLTLLRRTRLSEGKEGSTVLEVTLMDASGQRISGQPINQDEWTAFACDIARRRAVARNTSI